MRPMANPKPQPMPTPKAGPTFPNSLDLTSGSFHTKPLSSSPFISFPLSLSLKSQTNTKLSEWVKILQIPRQIGTLPSLSHDSLSLCLFVLLVLILLGLISKIVSHIFSGRSFRLSFWLFKFGWVKNIRVIIRTRVLFELKILFKLCSLKIQSNFETTHLKSFEN